MANTADAPQASFQDSTWTTPALLAGIGFLVLWKSVTLIDRDLLVSIPPWFSLALTGILPQMFLLAFPLLTRRQHPAGQFRLPTARRLAKEAAICLPLMICCVGVVSIVGFVITQWSPETKLTPGEMDRMSKSPGSPFVYAFLIGSVFYAPIAEEIFFRGFLFNAFRNRMPLAIAVAAQSFIFGFAHFFGSIHAVTATFLGLVLTLVYWWRKTIFAPIFFHAGLNALSAGGMLLAMEAYASSAVMGVSADPSETQYVVAAVAPNSPAEKAGFHAGDEITHFDGHPIKDSQHLIDLVSTYEAGDSVDVAFLRDGQPFEVRLVLTSRRAFLER